MSHHLKEFPGVPLKDSDIQEGKVLTTRWEVKAEYAWDTGVALGEFFAGLKDGRILARQCDRCGRIVVPPRMFCEWCHRPNDRWVEVKDTGRVNTFSVSFVLWDASRVKVPSVPAVIEIDGCTPGVGFMHLLGNVGTTLEEILARVKIGMPVKAVWRPASERTGAITDIVHFVPREG
ncbi:MAG: Zn-ribbon domain-containing OB-fold protein [Acetobacteraceae bacterium]|nr:Zn-ribbon domain-containing OB-fold protein [Acetobacteraceae bacterium]